MLNVLMGVMFWPLVGLPAVMGTFFMLMPTLPLLRIDIKLFRRVVDTMVSVYLVYVVSLIELVYGMKVVVSGDKIHSTGNNLVIMNHNTRLDWMFFWSALWRYSYTNLMRHKITLKYPIKFWPGIGPPTQFAAFIFMKRNFQNDKTVITSMLEHYQRVEKDTHIIFFPEGTDRCANAIRRSAEFAEKNGLTLYDYVLHPRVTGFNFITSEIRRVTKSGLHSLYDVTVSYISSNGLPQTELEMAKGKIPEEIHFHVRRYADNELPKDEQGLQDFCKDRWKEKESKLKDFYTGSKRFTAVDCQGNSGTMSESCSVSQTVWLMLSLVYWLPFTFISLYYTFSSFYVFIYCCLCLLTISFINRWFDGLDTVQAQK